MAAKPAADGATASKNITQRIEELGDWRGETLGRLRKLIHDADPKIVEEWKWMGTPVFSHDGIVCTGESYKAVVKLTSRAVRRCRIPTSCSTRVSRAVRAAPSMSAKAKNSTKPRSRS
jgi:hypothetical protein